jgi:hypothetical protein
MVTREMRNKIDTFCYQKAINRANMVHTTSTDVVQADWSAAEVLMLDAGLGGYKKMTHISLPHYKELSDQLALNQYYKGGLPQNSYERSVIPNRIAGFDMAFRADYRLSLNAATAAGITVSGTQSHTVAAKDGNDNYIDNRQMVLTVSATTNVAIGDKFTINGVNRLNPEVREDTGELMTFTVLSVDSGTTMTISPAIIIDDPFQNCSAAAADTSPLVFLNSAKSNPSLFWADDAIKLIPGNLPVPEDVGGVERVDATTEQGLPFRFTKWYNPDTEKMYLKAVVFFDCEIWLPSQVGVILDNQ